jgi:hypothetical protein
VFSPDWLALREPADTNARSPRLTSLVSGALPPDIVHALDLGTGTGANVRYLADRLPGRQDWLLVDADSRLIEEARRTCLSGIARVVDLVEEVESPELGIFSGRDLVTASALLDLVSERWLHGLAGKCRQVGAAVLFSLTYNGEIRGVPEEPEDELIRDLVNRHQHGDKGFGPALGPAAAAAAERCFADRGYRVEHESTPWVLTPDTRDDVLAGRTTAELQRQLIDGWAEAASEMAPERTATIKRWRTRRLDHVNANQSGLTVGHTDLAAWLP